MILSYIKLDGLLLSAYRQGWKCLSAASVDTQLQTMLLSAILRDKLGSAGSNPELPGLARSFSMKEQNNIMETGKYFIVLIH